MQKQHIAILGAKSLVEAKNETDRQILALSTALVESDAQVSAFVQSRGKEKMFNGLNIYGPRRIFGMRFPILSTAFNALRIVWMRPDIVHLHRKLAASFAPILRFFLPQSVIATSFYKEKNLRSGRISAALTRPLKFVDLVFVKNRTMQSALKVAGIEAQVQSAIVPVKRVAVDDVLLAAMNVRSFRFVFVPVNDNVQLKDITRIAGIWQSMRESSQNKLVFASTSPLGKLEKKMQLALRDYRHVEFLGQKTGESLDALYSGARFIILPRANALQVMHVMRYGKACIVGFAKGIKLLMEGKGLVYRRNRSNDLKKQIRTLLKDSMQCASLGHAARCFVEDEHSGEVVAQEIFNAYQDEQRVKDGVLVVK